MRISTGNACFIEKCLICRKKQIQPFSREMRLIALGLLGGVHDVYQCENACLNVRDDNLSIAVQTEGGGHTID